MSAEKKSEIASLGGKAATNRHKWTSEQASEAARKAALARQNRRITPEQMAERIRIIQQQRGQA